MAESATKPDPAAEAAAASEPRLAKDETEKLTTGLTEDSKKEESGSGDGGGSGSGSGSGGIAGGVIGGAKAVTEKATSAVKDNMFSMFGGGTKKENKEDGSGEDGKKKEEGEADEPSGSAKALREKEEREKTEKGEKGEVNFPFYFMVRMQLAYIHHRMTKKSNRPRSTSSRSYA